MEKRFVIEGPPERVERYRPGYAVVTIDVIRATTTAITAVATGRRCFPAPSLDGARRLASILENPILAGELDGDMPTGFDINNSPAELYLRSDISRPLVLLSVYVACFRNCSSLSRELVAQGYPRIALLGAGSRGDFREEDQLCCAWIGVELARRGYAPQDRRTLEIVDRWANAQPRDCLISKSVDYLRRTGQLADLDFILNRVDDLDAAFVLQGGEIVMRMPARHASITDAAASRREGVVPFL